MFLSRTQQKSKSFWFKHYSLVALPPMGVVNSFFLNCAAIFRNLQGLFSLYYECSELMANIWLMVPISRGQPWLKNPKRKAVCLRLLSKLINVFCINLPFVSFSLTIATWSCLFEGFCAWRSQTTTPQVIIKGVTVGLGYSLGTCGNEYVLWSFYSNIQEAFFPVFMFGQWTKKCKQKVHNKGKLLMVVCMTTSLIPFHSMLQFIQRKEKKKKNEWCDFHLL